MADVQWDLLAGLGQNFFGAYDAGRKRAIEADRISKLKEISNQFPGQLPPASTLGAALLSAGDLSGAMTAAHLAQTQADRATQQQQWQSEFGLRQKAAEEPHLYGSPETGIVAVPRGGQAPAREVYRGRTPVDRALEDAGATPDEAKIVKKAAAGLGPKYTPIDPDKAILRTEGGQVSVIRPPGLTDPNLTPELANLPTEARKAALTEWGRRVVDNFAPKPNEHLISKAAEAERSASMMESEINNLEGLIDKHGAGILAGPEKTKLETSRTFLTAQVRKLIDLGVLNAHDIPVIDQIVVNPTANVLDPKTYGNAFDLKARAKANFGELRRIVRNSREANQAMLRPVKSTTQSGQTQSGSVDRDALLKAARDRGLID